MTFLPAPRAVALGGLLAALSAFTGAVPALVPGVVAGWLALVVLTLIDAAFLARDVPRLDASVEAPATAVRDDTLALRCRVSNGAASPLEVRVRLELPPQGEPRLHHQWIALAATAETTLDLAVRTPVRGDYAFGPIHLRARGRLAFAQAQRRVDAAAACAVLPDVRAVRDHILSRRHHVAMTPHLRTMRFRGLGSEFESLRDYEEGDDVRHIDWKATARHRRVIVRNYEVEHYRDILVLVDHGRLMGGREGTGTKLDRALDAALMLAGVALDSGDRCGVMTFHHEVTAWLKPAAGMPQLRRVLRTLYNVQPEMVETHFRRAFIYLQTRLVKRSLVVVLSDVADAEASRSLAEGLIALRRRHLVLFAALRTPEVEAVLEEPPADPLAPYRSAVAYRLLRDRAEVFARLHKGGVHLLDVSPARLTVPLVNRYIELRETNRL